MKVLRQLARHARTLHTSSQCRAITNLNMPSMSPTMEQGTINRWNVKEGDSFSAGDVLLSIETDKAEIEVEAQDDGIMGKILKNDGAANIRVGDPIALLAEEGDDISNLEAPKEEAKVESGSSSQSTPAQESKSAPEAPREAPKQAATQQTTPSHNPAHSGLLPSVQRLLASSNLDLSKIKATGKSGRYTKGDILAALGQASSSTGTYTQEREKSITHVPVWGAKDRPVGASTAKPEKPLDARALRGLIMKGMSASYSPAQKKQEDLSFDSILEGYLPKTSPLAELQRMNEQRARKELLGKGIPLSPKDPMEELFVL